MKTNEQDMNSDSGLNSWQRADRQRLSRRQFLAGTAAAGAGLAGLSLVGCGDDSGGGSAKQSGPAASTQTIKKGGTLFLTASTDPPTLDPYANTSGYTKGWAGYSYSRLFQYKKGPELKSQNELRVEGDLVQSYEVAPDRLTYTLKLRPEAKWHPPIARQVTAEDIAYSWDRFQGTAPGTTKSPNAVLLGGAIDSVKAVDPATVQIKVKRPLATFTTMLADGNDFWVMPKEIGTAFNPSEKMVGSGPFIFESYRPGVSAAWVRNPSWHLAGPNGAPYIDRIEVSIIKDSITALNQFIGGNLDVSAATLADYPRLKALPGAQTIIVPGTGYFFVMFSTQRPGPWQDPRVRQAVSMAIDKDAVVEGLYNINKVKAEGAVFESKWAGALAPGYGDLWVDPKTDPKVSKYYKYDPAEAKKLLDAAGFPNGFEANYPQNNSYGALSLLEGEIIGQMVSKVGIKLKAEIQDYSVYVRGAMIGQFEGIAYGPTSPREDAGDQLESMYRIGASANRSQVNDPEVERMINSYQSDFEPESRKKKIRDFQYYVMEKMYYIGGANSSIGMLAYGPKVRNAKEYANGIGANSYGFGTERLAFYWKE